MRFFIIFLILIPINSFASDTNYDIGTVQGVYDACKNVIAEQDGKKEYDKNGYGLCFGYIRGVKDSYDMRQLAGAKGNICPPEGTTWLELIKIFVKWADDNPKELHNTAWTGVVLSWSKAFPCK